jgi:nucleoside-diphosphate-sugar epimerase
MERILITGGAGYIGSVMVPTLIEAGYHVTVLDSFYYQQATLMDVCYKQNFEIIRGDCRDKNILKKCVPKADYIIPLAALVGAPLCKADEIAAQTVNSDAIRTLASIASASQKIIYPTTNSGYGIGEAGKMCTEESPLKPISLYGVTKCEAEATVLGRENGLTFRLATVFGVSPRMRVDLLVNDFVHRAVTDRAVVIFEGHFKRNFIHIRDVCGAFMHAMKNFDSMRGQAYNVGLSDANISKLELCETIKRILPEFVYLEAPIGEDPDKRDYIVSNAKIEKTGWRPKHSLPDGIHELIKAFAILRNSKYSNV